MRIYVVENHPDTLTFLGSYLEACGHHVRTAQTVAQALRGLRAEAFDLLLSDLVLPDGDGWKLLESLGSGRPRFAVAMSGKNTPEDRARSEAAGFQRHLVKPFTPDEIDDVLRACEAEDKAR
jgi:DNA-binding response OmpR family regulator